MENLLTLFTQLIKSILHLCYHTLDVYFRGKLASFFPQHVHRLRKHRDSQIAYCVFLSEAVNHHLLGCT